MSAISDKTRQGTLELSDGRTLAYADRGPLDGAPLADPARAVEALMTEIAAAVVQECG